MSSLSVSQLQEMVTNDAALRRRQRLQPVGGRGDKIFPPTYPGEGRNAPPRHVYERRRVDGRDVWCVLVDSVQSQANRLEESLLGAVRDRSVDIPHVVVDFTPANLPGLAEITSLDAPHRVYDAILRDSNLGDEPFMKSEIGQRLVKAKSDDASTLLEISPTALLFGAWHSTGEGGGIGAKFARCLTSEVIAVDVPVEEITDERTGEVNPRTASRRTGSRIDPLGVLRKVKVYKGASGWDVAKDKAGRGAKEVRPSEINHGNIAPSVQPLGVTCEYLDHAFVLSFAALRRLRFGSDPRSAAGRAMLGALGLLAVVEQDTRGYSLRSRCELVCDGRAAFEVVHPDGSTDAITIERDGVRSLYGEAKALAANAGFALAEAPLRLTPQAKLIEIVRKSQELALSDEGGEGEDEAGA
jgi:CRISPR-associated protein Csb1